MNNNLPVKPSCFIRNDGKMLCYIPGESFADSQFIVINPNARNDSDIYAPMPSEKETGWPLGDTMWKTELKHQRKPLEMARGELVLAKKALEEREIFLKLPASERDPKIKHHKNMLGDSNLAQATHSPFAELDKLVRITT